MTQQADYTVYGHAIIPQDLNIRSLHIEEGGTISAPEGKYLLLTVDGVNVPAVPGVYEGDVRVSIRENFTRESLRFGEKTVSNYRAGAFVFDGKIVV